MTLDEALARLNSGEDILYSELKEIFAAGDLGFVSYSPSYGSTMYYHPEYETLGIFPAREWLGVMAPLQLKVVEGMLIGAAMKKRLGHTE